MTECTHVWKETYYGLRCELCQVLIPNGNGPWMPLEDELEDDDEESYYEYGTCQTCGGEYGPGWSCCTCDEDDFYPEVDDSEFDNVYFGDS
jgi:hypothetical protein